MSRASSESEEPLLALVGPTAAGKTEASLHVAEALGAEIVNVDSTLVFRGLDVWTGKPSEEERSRVAHHMIDVTDPVGPFSVATFQLMAREAIAAIRARRRRALLVGGSGLYYRAVVDGLDFPGTDPATRGLLETEAAVLGPDAMYARLDGFDAAAAARTTASNARRIVRALEVAAVTGRPFSGFATAWNRYPRASVRAAGLLVPREVLRARIDHRARTKFPRLLDEVRGLVRRGYGPFITSSHVIGYAEAAACLDGSLSSEDAIAKIARRDRALARRQMAWFRRDPRIRWFDTGDDETGPLVDRLIGYLGHRETSLAGAERVGAEGR